ncbi:hypothetical protein D0Z03_001389 [Geotrichum reessii]|nr:hypothetical protein D0Z03_001389 [Galactomyces reessii]
MESVVDFPPSSPPRAASTSHSENSFRSGYATPVSKTHASSGSALLPGFVPSSPESFGNSGVDSRKLAASLKHLASPTTDRHDALPSSPPPMLPDAKMFVARMGGHVKLYNDNAMYPSPAPTSSIGFRSSSPPPPLTFSEKEEKKLLVQCLDEKKNVIPVAASKSTISAPILVSIPRKGGKVTIGRSSKSSTFALSSKNKLVSRVHVAVTYIPHGHRVLFNCLGWNGCRITVPTRLDANNFEISENESDNEIRFNGQTDYILPKGQHIELKYVEGITINVRGERGLVKLVSEKKDHVREPLKAISDTNKGISRDVEMLDAPDLQSFIEKNVLSTKENQKKFSVEKISEKKKTLDVISKERSSVEIENGKKVLDEKNTEKEKVVMPTLPMRPGINLEKVGSGPVYMEQQQLKQQKEQEKSSYSLPKRPDFSSFPFNKLNSTTSTPMITFKRPLPPTIVESEQSTSSPSPQPKRSLSPEAYNNSSGTEGSLEPVKKKAKVVPSIDLERELVSVDFPNLANIICNHLAFSRLSSTPLSTLRSSSPVIGALSKHLLRLILKDGKRIPCVGVIYRQGKDAAGKPLEEEYYYMAENDTDSERRSMVEQLRGRGGGLRACRKTHKQYFWKKPSK